MFFLLCYYGMILLLSYNNFDNKELSEAYRNLEFFNFCPGSKLKKSTRKVLWGQHFAGF